MPRVRKIRKRKVNRAALQMDAAVDATLPSRFQQEQSSGDATIIVIVCSRIFNTKLAKLLGDEAELNVVATADTPREAVAAPNEHRAELVIIEADFGAPGKGILLAQTVAERSQGCAIKVVCATLTGTSQSTCGSTGQIRGLSSPALQRRVPLIFPRPLAPLCTAWRGLSRASNGRWPGTVSGRNR
jgi:hypothetical protein